MTRVPREISLHETLVDPAARRQTLLPDFARHAWASEPARQRWEPRLDAIRHAWRDIEWLSAAHGARPCALVSIGHSEVATLKERWQAHRLNASSVPPSSAAVGTGRVLAFVGERSAVRRALEAWGARDDLEVGSLLGYPECCRRFFRHAWVESGRIDTTLDMALGGPFADRTFDIAPPAAPHCNVLWRRLGPRAVAHLPCAFSCAPTLAIGRVLWEIGDRAGYGAEREWLEEILSWPAAWSALHGIAEVKTPVLKIAMRTDHTDQKWSIRWHGTCYPEEGASGLAFPYRPLPRAPKITLRDAARGGTEARAADGILDAAIAAIPETVRAERRVTRLRLSPYFNMVALDDGSVGAAANYAGMKQPALDAHRAELEAALARDPLLLATSAVPGNRLLISLRTAIASALVAPVIRQGGDHRFTVRSSVPEGLFDGARTAVVIGFGGYMATLAASRGIIRLHVADLLYAQRRAEMDGARQRFLAARSELEMTMSDGSDIWRRMACADLVCITGSALCNGSMEGLLRAASACRRVIVQGQSAAVHPAALFRRGVATVSTTVKPTNLIDLSEPDARRALEGGLATVYLTPGGARRGTADMTRAP